MTIETLIDVVGTFVGVVGVCLAVYLQLVTTRNCHPHYVVALFLSGAALIMVFSDVWGLQDGGVLILKAGSVVLFAIAEGVTAYFAWKTGAIEPPMHTVASLLNDENGGQHG